MWQAVKEKTMANVCNANLNINTRLEQNIIIIT